MSPAAAHRPKRPQRAQIDTPELIFFTGKGGVGKTTIAASYALWRARARPRERVALLSTDPAHSLADVLDVKLPAGGSAVRVGTEARLTVNEIDAERRFGQFLSQYREPLLAAIEAGTVFTREEIEPLISSTLPGMTEIAALLAINDAVASAEFDCIVVDTAPFGHTLRLFQLPHTFEKLVHFLDIASSRDAVLAAHFGGRAPAKNALLREWQALLDSLLADLRKNAGVVLVTTAEPFALQESARVAAQMRDMQPPLRFTRMVLNRAVTASSSCEVCSARYAEARRARQYLRQHFPRLPMLVAPDLGAPVVGVNQLLSYGRRVFGRGRLATKTALPAMRKPPRLKASRWPAVEQQLSITLGKGGVGKTTISAAMAVRLRERNKPAQVAVCSTDPAPSLDDVFEQPVGAQLSSVAGDEGLLSAEIDAAGEFHSWAEAMNRRIEGALTASPSAGIRVDLSFERQLFSALLDVVPPGIDELFAVLKISKLLRGKGDTRLVLDMAPTGHALELLRTPERILHWSRLLLKTLALHRTLPFARNIGAELAQLASDVRWLQGRLRAADATAAWVVMLAEPLPDRETARLVAQLHSLRVPLTGIVVNRVLFGRNLRCPRCRTRAAWQASSLAGLRKNLPPDLKIYCLADQEHGISGVEGLKRFSRKIWRLA